MATSKVNLMQTAFNAAATLTAAELAAGFYTSPDFSHQRFVELAEEVFEKLVKEYEAEEPAQPAQTRSADDVLHAALDTTLKYGAFKGLTLGQVFQLPASKAAEYGYGDGQKSGRDYIAWLAGPRQENKFLQKQARVIIEAAQAGLIS